MERTLVILRHAKADRPAGVTDADRPLTQRGHADAAAAGAWLAARGYRPRLVLCSPSKRTRQTWRGVAVALTGDETPEVHYDQALYFGDAEDLLELLRAVPETVGSVLLIGHNPTVSMLSSLLDRGTDRDSDGLRTSGIAVHTQDGGWTDLSPGSAPVTASYTARAGG
jgi:phosphohistidine phosphatase